MSAGDRVTIGIPVDERDLGCDGRSGLIDPERREQPVVRRAGEDAHVASARRCALVIPAITSSRRELERRLLADHDAQTDQRRPAAGALEVEIGTVSTGEKRDLVVPEAQVVSADLDDRIRCPMPSRREGAGAVPVRSGPDGRSREVRVRALSARRRIQNDDPRRSISSMRRQTELGDRAPRVAATRSASRSGSRMDRTGSRPRAVSSRLANWSLSRSNGRAQT